MTPRAKPIPPVPGYWADAEGRKLRAEAAELQLWLVTCEWASRARKHAARLKVAALLDAAGRMERGEAA